MTVAAIVAMAIGTVALVRSVVIVTMGGRGRFPLDPWVSLVGGFALILLGRALLE